MEVPLALSQAKCPFASYPSGNHLDKCNFFKKDIKFISTWEDGKKQIKMLSKKQEVVRTLQSSGIRSAEDPI